jgi:hypothetical protein
MIHFFLREKGELSVLLARLANAKKNNQRDTQADLITQNGFRNLDNEKGANDPYYFYKGSISFVSRHI